MRNTQVKNRLFYVAGVALLGGTLTGATVSSADASAVRSGFDANDQFRNDDQSLSVDLPFDVNFFGTSYNSMWINTNGNVTFDNSLSTYTPFNLQTTSRSIIAPFFADVDTRAHGEPVRYGSGTVNGRDAFGVSYIDVDYYSSNTAHGDQLNSFQLVMIDRSDIAPGDFDFEFNYDQILWETGGASGGEGGFGGNSARVGYSNGETVNSELAGSAVNGAFLDSNTDTGLIWNSRNSDVDGRYIFQVRNGLVEDDPNAVIVPLPAAGWAGLVMLGAVGGVAGLRRKLRPTDETV